MNDIHGFKISHQTVLNYAKLASDHLDYFVNNYDYELSQELCGDETYIRIKGKWHYIFFFFDATKKIILSRRVSKHRDLTSAVKALNDVLMQFKKISENLNIIVDGNPIYLVARNFFAANDIKFNISQVIRLENKDIISKEFRPLKQIIECLNRSYKLNYQSSTGFKSEKGSISHVTLFTAYFNFLRPHSSLNYKIPVPLQDMDYNKSLPNRWCKLIKIAENFN